jgi:multidrug transporter EmrE-like cation transporter
VTFRKYLVLAGITVFSTAGDSLLARGMKNLLLLAFFTCYMSALSWADLTYVLPATSLGYVLVALIAHFSFHEEISPTRWIGIALISAGVGLVAAGPSVTPVHETRDSRSASAETVSAEVKS